MKESETSHINNPYQVGDIVTCTFTNGTGEGLLWGIDKIKGNMIHVEVVYTVTGASRVNPKWLHWRDVDPVDIVFLGLARAKLDQLINDLVKRKSSSNV